MDIISVNFFAIFILSVIIYWLLPSVQLKNAFLSFISLSFFYCIDRYIPLMILGCTVFSFFIAQNIEKSTGRKAFFHKLGVGVLLSILIFGKYKHNILHILYTSNLVAGNASVADTIIIPLGISYIIFKLISYITDVYWEKISAGDFLTLLNYSSLFTIYSAGPIERFENFSNIELNQTQKFKWIFVLEGFEKIAMGMFKKLVVGGWASFFITYLRRNNDTPPLYLQILVAVSFSIQIYMDFAGYSDIAIGTSRMFGYKIMENFSSPYLQPNISQFWRCWHISLSDWIRDYVFYPLQFAFKDYRLVGSIGASLIAFLICGLWHGATVGFVIWGLWHGAGIGFYFFWSDIKKKNDFLENLSRTKVFYFASVLLTFSYVTIGWLFFK